MIKKFKQIVWTKNPIFACSGSMMLFRTKQGPKIRWSAKQTPARPNIVPTEISDPILSGSPIKPSPVKQVALAAGTGGL